MQNEKISYPQSEVVLFCLVPLLFCGIVAQATIIQRTDYPEAGLIATLLLPIHYQLVKNGERQTYLRLPWCFSQGE